MARFSGFVLPRTAVWTAWPSVWATRAPLSVFASHVPASNVPLTDSESTKYAAVVPISVPAAKLVPPTPRRSSRRVRWRWSVTVCVLVI